MPNHEAHLKALFAVVVAASSALVSAKDLGVSGTLWPIDEVDMRQIIVNDAAKVDWEAVGDRLKESAKQFPSTLRPTVTAKAQKTSVRYIDPSVALDSDVEITRKRADGSYEMVPFYRKGTRVNPLEHMRPVRALLFIDANDSAQLQLAKRVLERNALAFAILTTNGTEIVGKAKELNVPLFYAYPQVISRFEIKAVPTLVHPGFGAQRNLLAVTELAEPYDPELVLRAWPGGGHLATPKATGAKK